MLSEPPVPTLETDMAKAPQNSLEGMTGRELEELIQKAQTLKQERKAATIQTLREKWQAEAEDEGLELREVFPPPAPPKAPREPREPGTRTPARIKYRHPDDPSLTYTGRGRLPNWMAEDMEKTSKTKDDYLLPEEDWYVPN